MPPQQGGLQQTPKEVDPKGARSHDQSSGNVAGDDPRQPTGNRVEVTPAGGQSRVQQQDQAQPDRKRSRSVEPTVGDGNPGDQVESVAGGVACDLKHGPAMFCQRHHSACYACRSFVYDMYMLVERTATGAIVNPPWLFACSMICCLSCFCGPILCKGVDLQLVPLWELILRLHYLVQVSSVERYSSTSLTPVDLDLECYLTSSNTRTLSMRLILVNMRTAMFKRCWRRNPS